MDKIKLTSSIDLVIIDRNIVKNPAISLEAVGLYSRMIAFGKKEYTENELLWFCNVDKEKLYLLLCELKKVVLFNGFALISDCKEKEPEFE